MSTGRGSTLYEISLVQAFNNRRDSARDRRSAAAGPTVLVYALIGCLPELELISTMCVCFRPGDANIVFQGSYNDTSRPLLLWSCGEDAA